MLAATLAAGAVTNRVRAGLDEAPPGGPTTWVRTNHRGAEVSLLEGPAVAAGILGGLVASGEPARSILAAVVATGSGAVFGLVDDLTEDTERRTKGLRGHLGALARGEVTTGGLKVLGIGAGALLAASIGTKRSGSTAGWAGDVVLNAALVAASANLVNLLDLRPGRALKASLAVAAGAGAAGVSRGTAGAVAGAAGMALGSDLAERDMLGDGGANALGAALGSALAFGASRRARLAAAGVAVGLTLASERVSFSAVIARTPGLRELDALGRVDARGRVREPGRVDGPRRADAQGRDA